MIVEVTQNPGGFVDKSLSIPPGGHQYICYSDFHIGSNPDRVIDVRFYVGSATKTVSPSEIRDHGKLVLNYQDDTGTGTVTVTFIKGKLIPRIGLFIKLNRAAKKMKSLVKHIIGGIINETS
uniref:Uncharacterized protein n=1 Tax=Fagus sylvatica TaxID=28930 RepID=A0A2N9G4V3_FAGSY